MGVPMDWLAVALKGVGPPPFAPAFADRGRL